MASARHAISVSPLQKNAGELRRLLGAAHELVSAPTASGSPHSGGNGNGHRPAVNEPPSQPMMKIGDLCPECGEAAVVNEEGCRKCYACGFSEC